MGQNAVSLLIAAAISAKSCLHKDAHLNGCTSSKESLWPPDTRQQSRIGTADALFCNFEYR
jgi:hypothetical protein